MVDAALFPVIAHVATFKPVSRLRAEAPLLE
jgi:hypothetical protein